MAGRKGKPARVPEMGPMRQRQTVASRGFEKPGAVVNQGAGKPGPKAPRGGTGRRSGRI